MARPLPPEVEKLLTASSGEVREAAWASFLRSHSRLIMFGCRTNGSGPDGTMDNYTFVLEKLRDADFKRLRTFDQRGKAAFDSWLLVVVRRLCIDFHRQRFGRNDKGADASPSLEQTARRRLAELVGEELELDSIEDGTAPADETLHVDRLNRALERALSELPPQDQLLMTLRFKDDLSVRKIAKVLGHSNPFRLYRRIDKVLGTLRRRLEEEGYTRAP